jgi:fengycin family lipopeptide synthetase D
MFTKSDIADIYPLAPMQESILLHHRLHPESRQTYLEQRSYRITGSLDIAILQEAFNRLVERHGSLRTIFVAAKSKRPMQIMLKPRPVPWHQKDLRSEQLDEQEQAVRELRKRDREKGLDCEREIPVRITLAILGQSSFELIWTMHHIVVDGWSAGLLYAELMELYRSGVAGGAAQLPVVVPYSRYITWLENRDQQESLRFWQQELAGYQAEMVLPGQRISRDKQPFEAQFFQLSCAPDLAENLRQLASQWQVTVSTLIHMLWGVLLGWYNDCDDVVFGSVVSGRPESLVDAERMVGLCINTIPVRIRMRPGLALQQLAQTLQQHSLAASDHHFCNLAEIQNVTEVKRKLINHIVAVENFPRLASEKLENITIQPTGAHEQINYDLALVVVPHDPFEIELHYNGSVFAEAAVNTIGHHFHALLTSIVTRSEMTIEACDPLTAKERIQLDSLNDTTRPFDAGTLPVAIFQRQVMTSPTAPAVVDHDGCVDYRELSDKAGQIASYLHRQPSFTPGSCVGIMIDRCRWLPAAFFGVLRAGGTYVPLDPQSPASRASTILKDCGCEIILTVPHVQDTLTWAGDFHVVDVTQLEGEKDLSGVVDRSPDDVAYIIYTSGSTGAPKGVAIAHSSVVNFGSWASRYYSIGKSTRGSMFSSPAFDATIWEMIPVLLYGGSVHCLRDTFVDAEGLITYYREHGINLSYLPPVLGEEICRIHNGRLSPDFKLITGADVVRYAGDGSLRVFNNYGPTEATVITTVMEVSGFDSNQRIPIGFPIDNTEVFILDHHGRRVAPGAVGELFIGGAGVARGYVGRRELTSERFVPHPVRKGEKIYKTGDLVRLSEKWGLEFIGRIDTQMQVRGYRIEPSEIENCLRNHPLVQDGAVVDRKEPSGIVLVAFLIPTSEQRVPAHDLRRFLQYSLPEYMIPTRFGWMERFPFTERGKIDRDALRAIELPNERESQHESPPESLSMIEEQLVAIWRDVIGAQSVGRNDNFFSLGGHSLSATRMASRIRTELSVELSLRVIFDTPVLAELARHIEDTMRSKIHEQHSSNVP